MDDQLEWLGPAIRFLNRVLVGFERSPGDGLRAPSQKRYVKSPPRSPILPVSTLGRGASLDRLPRSPRIRPVRLAGHPSGGGDRMARGNAAREILVDARKRRSR